MFKWLRERRLKREIKNAVKTLRAFDGIMIRAKMTRAERRMFWRQFYKDETLREQLFKQMKERVGIKDGDN